MSSPTRPDNQRLEFLGDRVLGLVISEALLKDDMSASEGQLAPRYNALVRKETCADIARDIDIGAVLKLGRSEMMSGGRRKTALLGDAMEAVIGALYLDGGIAAVRRFVVHCCIVQVRLLCRFFVREFLSQFVLGTYACSQCMGS